MSLLLRRKATTGAGAAALDAGELAVNLADLSIYLGTAGGNKLLLGAPLDAGTAASQTVRWNASSGRWEGNSNFTVTAAGAVVANSTIQGTTITATTGFVGAHTSGSITGTTGDAYNSLRLGGTLANLIPTTTTANLTLTLENTASTNLNFDNCVHFRIQNGGTVSGEGSETVTFLTA